ncbi:MAG TPA: carboxypeptidase-like regulatory domain-containing protein, partial [Terriglobales bacterium]|nr:carboxypeptidase-like regulatory domain-containing protein [Terriglobales bacterium]
MSDLRVELHRLQFFFGITLAISALLAQNALGQASYTAQVRGSVTDQTGAVVQNAKVTITNDGTGVSTSAKTDDHGFYLLTGLRPNTYTIRAEASGFRTAENKNVVLAVDQQATLNFNLNPVGVMVTVEVTEAPPLLDTESGAIGTDVSNEYVRDIPLYNRSYYGLVFLAGGVTETTGSGINDNYPSGTNFVSNGQRNATAQVSLDGSPLSAPEQGEGGNSNVYFQPSVEIVQEFKLQN